VTFWLSILVSEIMEVNTGLDYNLHTSIAQAG
jgi:hypothetical protein